MDEDPGRFNLGRVRGGGRGGPPESSPAASGSPAAAGYPAASAAGSSSRTTRER
jgi:hypothetical protein